MPAPNAIRKLARIQQTTRDELIARIKAEQVRMAEKIRNAAADPATGRSKAVRDRFFGAHSSQYESLAGDLDRFLKDTLRRDAIDWHNEALGDIKALGGRVRQSVLRFDRTRVQRYWETINPDNASSLTAVFTQSMARSDIDALRQAFVDTYRQRALGDMNQNQFQKALQARWDELAGNLGGRRFVDARGRVWKNAAYLPMLVRTTTAKVARESYMDTLIANGDDLMRVSALGDSCPICQAWAGQIYSISGADTRFPSYQQTLDAGLWHPNCDCLSQRVDETVHAEDIARQAGTQTPSFAREQDETDTAYKVRMAREVGRYKAQWSQTTATPKTRTLDDVKRTAAEGRGLLNSEVTSVADVANVAETDGIFTRRTIDTTTLPDTLDRTVQQTSLANLKKQPGYEAAKHHGDDKAADDVVTALLKPDRIKELKAKLDPDKPIVFVPIVNSESNKRLNALPIQYAQELSRQLGGTVETNIVKVLGTPNTGATQAARLTKEIGFNGELSVKGAQIVIVDDNYTSGRTIMAAMEHLKAQGGDVRAVTSLAASRYGAAIKTTPEALDKMRKIVGASDYEIERVIGHPLSRLTGTEVNAIAVSPAVRARGLAGLKRLYAAANGG